MATIIFPPAPATQAPTVVALADQATTIWNYANGNLATWTANGNRALRIDNLPTGSCAGVIRFVQGTGGGYTPTLPGTLAAGFAVAQDVNTSTTLSFTKWGDDLLWESRAFGVSSPVGTTTLAQAKAAMQAYLTRNANAGGTLDSSAAAAYDTFVTTIFNASLYDKLYEMWPVDGGVAAANALGLKGQRDLIFQGGWTHSVTGSKADGTTGYARTGIYPAALFDKNSVSLGYYSRTQTQASGDVLSATDGLDADQKAMRMVIRDQNTNRFFTEIGSAQQRIDSSTGGTNSTGLFVSSRASISKITAYRNGSVISSNASSNTGVLPSSELFLNAISKTGTPNNFSENECAFAFVGLGLTDNDVTTLYNAVQALQTARSRQV